jgi:hypothetical protein
MSADENLWDSGTARTVLTSALMRTVSVLVFATAVCAQVPTSQADASELVERKLDIV